MFFKIHYIKIDIKWFDDVNDPDDWFEPSVTMLGVPDLKDHIIDPNEIVIKDEIIKIRFSYPLKNPTTRDYYSVGGFTRLKLAQFIYEGYYTIYDEEEKAVGNPGHIEGLYNRETSYGPYGIWGHEMGDISLTYVNYIPSEKYCWLKTES